VEVQGPPLPALHIAALSPGVDLLEATLRGAPDVNAVEPGPMRRTALHIAAAFNRPRNVSRLIEAGANLRAAMNNGITPIIAACMYGHTDVVRVLLEEGHDDPNGRVIGGTAPLHAAAMNDRVEVTRLLLQHGADPHQATVDGWTPVHIALKKENRELVEILTAAPPLPAPPAAPSA